MVVIGSILERWKLNASGLVSKWHLLWNDPHFLEFIIEDPSALNTYIYKNLYTNMKIKGNNILDKSGIFILPLVCSWGHQYPFQSYITLILDSQKQASWKETADDATNAALGSLYLDVLNKKGDYKCITYDDHLNLVLQASHIVNYLI